MWFNSQLGEGTSFYSTRRITKIATNVRRLAQADEVNWKQSKNTLQQTTYGL